MQRTDTLQAHQGCLQTLPGSRVQRTTFPFVHGCNLCLLDFLLFLLRKFSWAVLVVRRREGTEVNHPTYCWKAGQGDLSLRDNHNGTDKSRSQIKYRCLYLKGGSALQKEGDNNYICSTLLFIFNLVLPGETKLVRLFSFPLVALLHSWTFQPAGTKFQNIFEVMSKDH